MVSNGEKQHFEVGGAEEASWLDFLSR